MSKSTKLYHHLITESEVKGQYAKITEETNKRFKGESLFEGLNKIYKPREDDGQPLEDQIKELVTTVPERLAWTRKSVEKFINFEATREIGNSTAKADLIVNGETLATGLPAMFLLSLEKRLAEVRKYYDKAPTLDLSRKWESTDREGIFKHGPVVTYRTAKKTVPVILYEATDRHPAQVQPVTEDVTIGAFDTTVYSGAIQPGDKARMLQKIDLLIEAAKKARMRANETEIQPANVAGKIFDFIHS